MLGILHCHYLNLLATRTLHNEASSSNYNTYLVIVPQPGSAFNSVTYEPPTTSCNITRLNNLFKRTPTIAIHSQQSYIAKTKQNQQTASHTSS